MGRPISDGQRTATERDEAFSRVFAHRTMLHAYLSALIRDPALVEDALSESVIEIVHSYGRYDRSLPFGPWARGVARRVALTSLRKGRRLALGLGDEALAAFEAALDQVGDQATLESRKGVLRECLDGLTPGNRQLVQLRYFDELSPETIAARVGRSVGAIYTAFSRIHAALLRCLQEKERA